MTSGERGSFWLPGMPAVLQPRRPEGFELLYEGTPPWETGRPSRRCWPWPGPGRSGGGSWTWADLGEQFDTSIEPLMLDRAVQRGAVHAWLAAITRT